MTEKEIYKIWKKRFSYPVSSIESQAENSLERIKSVKPISERSLREKIKQHRLIVLGDDATNIQHKRMIQNLLGAGKYKSLWITNRSKAQIAALKTAIKKPSLKIFRVQTKNIQSENTLILKLLKANANQFDHIFIWTGHLRVSTIGFRKMFDACNPLFVSLQANQLRWKFPKSKAWVEASRSFIANLDTSALITVDQIRALDEKISILTPEELKPSFDHLLGVISKLLNQKKYVRPKHVLSVFDQQDILLSNKNFSAGIREFFRQRMVSGESAVLPVQKTVLLCTLNPSHIAEEAAHQLRTGHRKNIYFGKSSIIVEEALAFFASLLLFPSRPIPQLFEQSRRVARNQKMNDWDEVHIAGYAIGYKLWKIWKRSGKSRELIKKLWNMYPTQDLEFEMMLSIMLDLK